MTICRWELRDYYVFHGIRLRLHPMCQVLKGFSEPVGAMIGVDFADHQTSLKDVSLRAFANHDLTNLSLNAEHFDEGFG